MTTILSKVIEKVEKLSPEMQNEIATQLLEDIENEQKWQEALLQSHNQLEILANKALDQSNKGNTKKIGFDEL